MVRATTSAALDASALLAFLFAEAGADDFVARAGATPVMSAVNWSEVCQKAGAYGVDRAELRSATEAAGLRVVELTADRAERAADLYEQTRAVGLSLADRACLALAIECQAPAVTADRSWTELQVPGLAVESLR